jgi:hypothetical protein
MPVRLVKMRHKIIWRQYTADVKTMPSKADGNIGQEMVPEEGVEPTRPCDQRILSAVRVVVSNCQ